MFTEAKVSIIIFLTNLFYKTIVLKSKGYIDMLLILTEYKSLGKGEAVRGLIMPGRQSKERRSEPEVRNGKYQMAFLEWNNVRKT